MDSSSQTIITTVLHDDDQTTHLYRQHNEGDDHSHLLNELSLKPRDRYKFIRTIGIGGMKTVLLVYDKDTRRNVALAMMPDYHNRTEQELAKFINEALITAKLEHPHIVPIHDIGLDSNMSPYFVMTFLSGMMLSSLLSRMKNNDEEILKFYYARKMLLNFQKICHAVEFAHSQGILHLDLKPANVHIGKYGEVHVLDWGLAKIVHDVNPIKSHSKHEYNHKPIQNITSGTPGYMAPEQAQGKHLDCRTDVYSLGAILFSILMFKSPSAYLENATMPDLLSATVDGSIIDDTKMQNEVRSIPAELEAICRKAMATDPDDRYQSVKDLRDDIGNYLTNYPTLAEKPATSKKIVLFVKRNLVLFAISSALFMIIATFILLWYLFSIEKIVLNF